MQDNDSLIVERMKKCFNTAFNIMGFCHSMPQRFYGTDGIHNVAVALFNAGYGKTKEGIGMGKIGIINDVHIIEKCPEHTNCLDCGLPKGDCHC